ncbi:hypothetical protein [Terrihabitans sp. B22-R8]|uniref:hypothetical protein n=1 Tax=Terrihabitans sp. B22-R8 TaxID=3425128 RepID=UPI00403C989C
MNNRAVTAFARARQAASLAALAIILAGCSSNRADSDAGGGNRLANLFAFNTSSPKTVTVGQETVYCPSVSIQAGTAAYTVYERGQEGNILAVRNQARFGDIARECTNQGGNVGLRIGVAGRVMQGPKGVTGTGVDVPVRFVVLDSDDKPVISRVTRIQASIPTGQTGVSFTHVEDLGVLPVDGRGLRNWSFRVGFDTPSGTR